MSIDATLPDYRFVAASGLFPGIPEREAAQEQTQVNTLNAKGKGDFDFECTKWTSAATIARNGGQSLPPKPISPPSWVVLAEDGQYLGANGKFIARAQTGPVYGVCPDLPPVTPVTPGGGKLYTGDVHTITQDQKLDAIMAVCNETQALVKRGLGLA